MGLQEFLWVEGHQTSQMVDDESGGDAFSQIDDNLKRVYKDILSEDMPDRFRELLDRLNAQDDTTSPSADD